MIKAMNNLLISQFYRKIFLKPLYSFTSEVNRKPFFPYVFGGLKKVDTTENRFAKNTIQTFFGQESIEGFKEAYKSMLCMLSEKDQNGIKQIIEPTFFDRIKFRNVELINPDAQIEVICKENFFVVGGGFDRNNYYYEKMGDSSGKEGVPDQFLTGRQYISRNLYMGKKIGSNPKGFGRYATGQQTLIAFQILFLSSMKLIPEGGSREDKSPQIHSIQFQLEGYLDMSPLNILKTLYNIKVKGYFHPIEARKKVLEGIIGQNYEWKIGDMDRLLNKNLNLDQ